MITPHSYLRRICFLALLINSTILLSQNTPFWSNSGNNNVSSTDFLGSINNQSLRFKTNNIEHLRIDPNGFVGIGTTTPQYLLDVNGNARFNGTIYAQGIVIATRMQADTFKSTSLITVNNNLNFSAGTVNNIYTSTGDLRFQSNIGNGGNTLLNVGTSGNVGIGIFSPSYKLDVNGDQRVSGKVYVHRILPLAGDSEIHFGDSSIIFTPSLNRINGSISGTYKGLGIGIATNPTGLFSTAIGHSVKTSSTATNAIAMGSGSTVAGGQLLNTIPNSLMVGFNSTVPTFFVGSANGPGTLGKVGIGTTNPLGDFQVGDGFSSANMGGTSGSTALFSNSYFGFNVAHSAPTQWTVQGNGYANGGVAMFGTANGSLEIANFASTQSGTSQIFNDGDLAALTFFEIRNDGKVFIGTNPQSFNTPGTYRLYVQDGIITEKLKVVTQSNWSDYVFDSSYVLTPLDSVANFIQQNHHLPGVQSAADVKQNGIDVVETDSSFLAKIEALYLYDIQLQKQNDAMQKQNVEMQKEIDGLKKNSGRGFFYRRKK